MRCHAISTLSKSPLENRFALLKLEGLPVSAPAAAVDEEQVEHLLRTLLELPWRRLQSEYADPLGVLYHGDVRQWTAGWGPASSGARHMQSFYVLVWETESLKKEAQWLLYENGRSIYRGADHFWNPLGGLFKKLLESEHLPFVEPVEVLQSLLNVSGLAMPHQHRKYMAQALLNSLISRPDLLPAFKDSLFQMLEETMPQDSQFPGGLELALLNAMTSKNVLLSILRKVLEKGMMAHPADKQRAHRVLQFMRNDYFKLGYRMGPVYRHAYHQVYEEFRQMVTDGNWHVRLNAEARG